MVEDNVEVGKLMLVIRVIRLNVNDHFRIVGIEVMFQRIPYLPPPLLLPMFLDLPLLGQ